MNNLLKNPLVIGGVLLVLVIVAVAGKLGGPTYAATSTDPAAFKARAEAQAVADESLGAARGDIMTAILGYSSQRDQFRLGMGELRSNYDLGMEGLRSNERLGMAGIGLQREGLQSAERMGYAELASSERMNTVNNQTTREGQRWDFGKAILNIVPNILKLFGVG